MPLGTEIGLGPGHIELDGDPAIPHGKGHSGPHFRPMSVVAKLSPISATTELLYKQAVAKTKKKLEMRGRAQR